MIIENKLDKSFGSTGSFAGYILLLAGVVTIRVRIGFLLLILGFFFAFSHTGVQIDTERKRIRFYNNLFGFLKIGAWSKLDKFTSLKVAENKRREQAFSRGNRTLNIEHRDFRVFLISQKKQARVAVKKCKSEAEAIDEAQELGFQLGMPVIL
ncbi:MAG: hypothetical protein K9H64_03970 [Bacteroidales bacterium]|nr:hypothetical protein [Bacteroidales bacterium]MCF8455076.1 hypothetical protein [Bacteroidales bacterium]